jgi:hypothetical protein
MSRNIEVLGSAATWLATAIVTLSAFGATARAASEFGVGPVRTEVVDEVFLLDVDIDYALSYEALKALHNGVPVTFEVEIEVLEERRWMWDRLLSSQRLRYTLRYHALARLYQVTNLNSGVQLNFSSFADAARALGEIRNVPILHRSELRPGMHIVARVRAWLDIDSLPLPLRALAYLSPTWRLESNWYTWALDS